MTKDEIAAAFPFAVERARELKDVFGDGVRILKASQNGQTDLVSSGYPVNPVPPEPPSPPQTKRKRAQ